MFRVISALSLSDGYAGSKRLEGVTAVIVVLIFAGLCVFALWCVGRFLTWDVNYVQRRYYGRRMWELERGEHRDY